MRMTEEIYEELAADFQAKTQRETTRKIVTVIREALDCDTLASVIAMIESHAELHESEEVDNILSELKN